MKKFFVLFALLMLSILGVKAQQPYDVCVGGIYYDLHYSDGRATATVECMDSSPNYDWNSKAYVGNIVIPSEFTYRDQTYKVTGIESYAFRWCKNLTSITIPTSIITIKHSAFSGCTGLTSVHISDISAWCKINFHNAISNPLYVAHYLFLNDTEIKDLVIPNGITNIGDRAFYGCSGLTSVSISDNIKSIGNNAFERCSGLNSVTLCSSNLSLSSNAFEGCTNVKKLIYGEGCTKALSTGLTSVSEVSLPQTLQSIEANAFANFKNLKEITIPNSVTSISGSAFRDCSGLTSIDIPNSVTSIGGYAFHSCI